MNILIYISHNIYIQHNHITISTLTTNNPNTQMLQKNKIKINNYSQHGIQLLQSKNKIVNMYTNKFHNQLILQELPDDTRENVSRLLQYATKKQTKNIKKYKLYSLFYVNPLDMKTGLWDLFIILIIYIFQIQISLTLGFGPTFLEEQISSRFYQIAYFIMVVLLVIDIIINFHKGYYAFGRGKVIDDHYLIIKHYLKIYFVMDVVTITLLVIPFIKSTLLVNLLQLIPAVLLYFKKFKYQNQIIGMLQYSKKLRIFFIIFMLICDFLLIGHFGACIFVGIDLILWRYQYYGNNPQYYWLSNNSMYSINLIDGFWLQQYIYAQSFSTGTLSTIAPGPFGKNPIQILYANIVMIFFMLLASYAAQILVSILLSQNEIRTFHEDNIQNFDNFMRLKGVREEISAKIHNFFQLVWETQVKMNVEDQKQVLEKLPTSLRDQLLIEMQFIKNLKLFTLFSNSELLLRILSSKVTSNVIDGDRILLKAGPPQVNMEQRYLYYFKEGLAKFYIQSNKSEYTISLSNLQRVVGQFQFMTELSYSFSCKTVELCMVSKLGFDDLHQAIQQNGMIEEYLIVKYRLLIQNQLSLISKICLVCQQEHTENNCGEINIKKAIQQKLKRKKKPRIIKQRRNFIRKNIISSKVTKIQPKTIAKAHIVLIFMAYKGLGQFFLSAKVLDKFEQVKQYQKYYPQYNLDRNYFQLI